jgi:hypothetical protein
MTNLRIRPSSGQKNVFRPAGGQVAVKSRPVSSSVGGGEVLLSSDWSQGVGTTDALLIEDGKPNGWDQAGGSGSPKRITVVSATGFGFPAGMDNCLRVEHPIGAQNYGMVQKFWDLPAVGETLYYRWYFMCDVSNAEADGDTGALGGGYHPLETPRSLGDFGTDGEIVWKHEAHSDGTWRYFIEGQNNFNQRFAPGLNARTSPTDLLKFRPYRFEMKLTRVSAGSPWDRGAFDIRVYDESISTTVPQYDRDNMWYWDFNGGVNEGTIADGYGQDVYMLENGFTSIETGTNGGDWSPTAVQYEYWGGFRVVKGGDWIGPYVPGEE